MEIAYNYDNIIIDGKHPKSILYNNKPVEKLQYNGKDLIHKFNCYNFKYKISGTLGSIKFTNDGKLEFKAYELKLQKLSGSDNFSYNSKNTMYNAFELTIHKCNGTTLDSDKVISFSSNQFEGNEFSIVSDPLNNIIGIIGDITNMVITIPAITFEHTFTITTNEKQYEVTDTISTAEQKMISLDKNKFVNLNGGKDFDVLKEYYMYY